MLIGKQKNKYVRFVFVNWNNSTRPRPSEKTVFDFWEDRSTSVVKRAENTDENGEIGTSVEPREDVG